MSTFKKIRILTVISIFASILVFTACGTKAVKNEPIETTPPIENFLDDVAFDDVAFLDEAVSPLPTGSRDGVWALLTNKGSGDWSDRQNVRSWDVTYHLDLRQSVTIINLEKTEDIELRVTLGPAEYAGDGARMLLQSDAAMYFKFELRRIEGEENLYTSRLKYFLLQISGSESHFALGEYVASLGREQLRGELENIAQQILDNALTSIPQK